MVSKKRKMTRCITVKLMHGAHGRQYLSLHFRTADRSIRVETTIVVLNRDPEISLLF